MKANNDLVLFDPSETNELLRGWQLHTLRRRTIHELAARRAQRWGYVFAAVATVFSAIAGSSAFAAVNGEVDNEAFGFVALALGVAAAVLAPLQSTLDLGGRAERHRQAAVEYKRLLRRFERIAPRTDALPSLDADGPVDDVLRELETAISDVDAAAPIVPARLARAVEDRPLKPAEHVDKLVSTAT